MALNRLLADATFTIDPVGVNPGVNGAVSLEKVISQVIGVLTIVAVLYFVIQIILAGYAFISSEGDPKKIEMSRKRLTEGVLGITIVVVAVGLGSLLANLAGIPNILNIDAMLTLMGL